MIRPDHLTPINQPLAHNMPVEAQNNLLPCYTLSEALNNLTKWAHEPLVKGNRQAAAARLELAYRKRADYVNLTGLNICDSALPKGMPSGLSIIGLTQDDLIPNSSMSTYLYNTGSQALKNSLITTGLVYTATLLTSGTLPIIAALSFFICQSGALVIRAFIKDGIEEIASFFDPQGQHKPYTSYGAIVLEVVLCGGVHALRNLIRGECTSLGVNYLDKTGVSAYLPRSMQTLQPVLDYTAKQKSIINGIIDGTGYALSRRLPHQKAADHYIIELIETQVGHGLENRFSTLADKDAVQVTLLRCMLISAYNDWQQHTTNKKNLAFLHTHQKQN